MTSNLTDEQAEALLKTLSKHYGQPVMPIDRYCDAIRLWGRVMSERVTRLTQELYPKLTGPYRDPEAMAESKRYQREIHGEGITHSKIPGPPDTSPRGLKVAKLKSFVSADNDLGHTFILISKSSLLARILYGGEKLRTKMCPEHKGTWSGLEFVENVCPHGCQLTGWLPEPLEAESEKTQ